MRVWRWSRVVALVAVLASAGCGQAITGPSMARSGSPTLHRTPPRQVSTPHRTAPPVRPVPRRPSRPAPPGRPAGSPAAAALEQLPVRGRAPMTGYDRDLFGSAWTDDNNTPDGHNGCDTRNDILRRDLTAVALKPGTYGCVVLSGTLHDPYTGTVIHFVRGPESWRVQIDHVVALGDAWQTGAQQLPLSQRIDLANDPLELLAVDGSTNEQKGDGDAATWLPPSRSYRCSYVARQVAVKRHYRLWVTPAERDAMARVLAGCPGQPLP